MSVFSDRNMRLLFQGIVGHKAAGNVASFSAGTYSNPSLAFSGAASNIPHLEGTNVEEGRKILKDSGLKFEVGTTMKDAADLAVAAAKVA